MKNKSLLFVLATSLLALASCGPTKPNDSSTTPGESTSSPVSIPDTPVSTDTSNKTSSDSSNTSSDVKPAEYKTIAEIKALAPEDGSKSETRYRVRAKVVKVSNPVYGEMTIKDETGEVFVYGTYDKTGEKRYSELPEEERPVAGDDIELECNVQNYKNSQMELVSAWILSFTHNAPDIDLTQYKDATVAAARASANGSKVHMKNLQVLSILFGQKNAAQGVMVSDGTDSIYVFSTDVAGRVQVGDKIEIAGEKTNYVLGKEQTNAAKYGYKGCNQIENVTLLNKTAGNGTIDLTFAQPKTVKEIVETPVSEDISTKVYKANAYITKSVVEGPGGFTNYYFNDLDGVTGNYVYSQNSGSDFAWIDPFVNKICTVYLTALNAKSTTYGCAWRFVPVKIEDNHFAFDKNDAAQFAIDYYAVDQFETSYVADPALEMTTAVSSTLLGFEGAKLTYASDNNTVASFEEKDGKTIFHTSGTGTANITISASLEGFKSATKKIAIERKALGDITAINVDAAKKAAVDTEVTVEGIVGPSLTVQDGFYLFDENGAIAVTLHDSAKWFAHVKMGQKIILNATRDLWTATKYDFGEQCLSNAKLVANEFGSHELPASAFITGKTISDLKKFDKTNDSVTLNVYALQGTITKSSGSYPTYSVADGTSSIQVYSSSISQYAFLEPFVGKTIDVEVALCNWNSKKEFKLAVLSATGEDGVKIYNTLHFKK